MSVPYTAWHASEGYTFEPDPVNTNSYRLAKVTGADGYDLNIYYDTDSCITSVVDAVSNTFTFSYSPDGYLTNITDITGNRHASFAYSNDLLISVTDMGGQTFQYGYNTNNGFLASFKQPSPTGYDETTISYVGDYSGATKVTVKYPEGNQSYIEWDGIMRDNLTGLGEKKLTYETYSWAEVATEIKDAMGRITSYAFYDMTNASANGRLQEMVNPDGAYKEYQYDSQGRISEVLFRDSTGSLVNRKVVARSYYAGTACLAAVTHETQDANANVLSRTAKEYSRFDNGTTNDASDDIYTLVSEKRWITSNEYAETRYIYDTNTWLLSEMQELVSGTNNYRTTKTFTYNSDHQVISTSDALTNTTCYTYDSLNRIVAIAESNTIARTTQYAYDSLDRLTNLVHPDGISESWTYDPCGCGVATHVDRGGNETVDTLNSNKWLKTRITTTTNGTDVFYEEYLYNSAGTVTGVVDFLGNAFRSEFNAANELVKTINQLGRETTYLYDSAGRQYKTIYPDGAVSLNTYDSASRVVQVARYANIYSTNILTSEQYSHDASGRRVTTTDALGNVTSNTFDMVSRTIRITRADGSFVETEYDLSGNAIEQIGPVPAGASQQETNTATTVSSYDVLNRPVSTTDPAGRVTTFEYDLDWPQQVARVRNNNGEVIQESFYDAFTGRLLTNISQGVQTSYEYNEAGQGTKTVFADESYASASYDGPRLLSQRSRTGNMTSFGFDALGRRTSVTNSLGNVTTFTYDAVGNQRSSVSICGSNALTNSYEFDSMNRLTVTTLPDGRASTNIWDALGRLVSRTGAGSVPVSYEYDALSRMTALIDGMTNHTGFAYDSLGRLTKKTYADGSFYSYGYNARGWLTLRTDPKGCQTAYAYNDVGRLTQVDYPTDTDVLYSFDNLGRMTQRVDSAGTWSWTYDGESFRATSEALRSPEGEARAVQYSYASNTFDLASVSFGPYTTAYSWAEGRLTGVVALSSFPLPLTFAYSYLPNSDLLETTTYLNGTVTVHRAYDSLSRLTNTSSVLSDSSVVNSFSYSLDSTGRRISRRDADDSQTTWKYDSYDQLTNAVRANGPNPAFDAAYQYGYSYDEVGNRLSESRGQLDLNGTHNNLNQLKHRAWNGKLDVLGSVASTNPPVTALVNGTAATLYTAVSPTQFLGGASLQVGSNAISIVTHDAVSTTETVLVTHLPITNPQVFTYDLNGNMIRDGNRTYTWDEENRLIGIETTENTEGTERRKSEYAYDAQGRRVEKRDLAGWTGSAYATTNVTRFIWDGWLMLSERVTDSTTATVSTNYHVWGLDLSQSFQGAGGIGGLLARVTSSTTATVSTHLYTADGNGNVIDVVDQAGAVVAHYEFDPFGRTVSASGPYADENPWRFSTKQIEPLWGLYYYGRRVLSPDTGRWLSRDPIAERGGLNLYGFVGNEPVGMIDPVGRSEEFSTYGEYWKIDVRISDKESILETWQGGKNREINMEWRLSPAGRCRCDRIAINQDMTVLWNIGGDETEFDWGGKRKVGESFPDEGILVGNTESGGVYTKDNPGRHKDPLVTEEFFTDQEGQRVERAVDILFKTCGKCETGLDAGKSYGCVSWILMYPIPMTEIPTPDTSPPEITFMGFSD